jgi:hypothetical protein
MIPPLEENFTVCGQLSRDFYHHLYFRSLLRNDLYVTAPIGAITGGL